MVFHFRLQRPLNIFQTCKIDSLVTLCRYRMLDPLPVTNAGIKQERDIFTFRVTRANDGTNYT